MRTSIRTLLQTIRVHSPADISLRNISAHISCDIYPGTPPPTTSHFPSQFALQPAELHSLQTQTYTQVRAESLPRKYGSSSGKGIFWNFWCILMPIMEGSTRNSSGDETANVNFLYDDIVHALQNTIDSCINSATDRRGYA